MRKITLLATILALFVVVLGAYTRLKDAGLGCPDWPGCYGQVLAPTTQEQIATLEASWQQVVEPNKAWIEMIHRYVASALGLIILGFALRILFKRTSHEPIFHPLCLLVLVVFQGMLGMWTVTMRLYPVVVMTHLMGGLTILATLWWYHLRLMPVRPLPTMPKNLRVWGGMALITVVIQLFLGGWVSANYAAVVCPDFPSCQGQWWPKMDFISAFNFISVGIFDSPGIPLEHAARVTIQMAHRIGALLTTIVTGIVIMLLLKQRVVQFRTLGKWLFIILLAQLGLGISNILAGLPLMIAVAHNAVAAIFLLTLVKLNVLLNYDPSALQRGSLR